MASQRRMRSTGSLRTRVRAHAVLYAPVFISEMANDFLGDHPELRPYVLSDVQLTGTTIGHGAYGSVEEVAVPVCGAAKKVHDLLLGSPKITSQFAEELQLMSTTRTL